jgi:tRNA (guanosine-2'-O-)-methyltransferase
MSSSNEEEVVLRAGPSLEPELTELLRSRPEEVIEALAPLMLEERLQRIEEVLSSRLRSVVVVLDHLKDPHNRAAILRTAEGMGVLEVHAITEDGRWPMSRRVTQGCHKWLDIRVYREAKHCAARLAERGFLLVEATEKSDDHQLPELMELTRPVAICLGNEHAGLTEELRRSCDVRLGVPMLGFTKSYNVSVAAALLLEQILAGRRRGLEINDETRLRARYYALSVRSPLDVLRRKVSR